MNIDPGLLPLAFVLLSLLAALAAPLAAALFFAGALLLCLNPHPLPEGFLLNHSLAMRLNSPALISVPLFALAGELAVAAGIAERLLKVADVLVGGSRRLVGARTILGCTLFATVSGVGPAAAAAEGKRLIPEMLDAGFNRATAAGVIATAAGLSIIIPASVPLTLYAGTTGLVTNIVFTASFLPGLLMAAALLAAALVHSRACGIGRSGNTVVILSRSSTLRDAKWALLMPVLVLTALFSGFLTAPEAAAFASAYAVAAGFLAHRSMGWGDVAAALYRAALAASAILLLAGVASLFLMLLEESGFNQRLAEYLFRLSGGGAGAILFMNLLLLGAGCFLDVPAVITLLVPSLLPLAAKCGMSVPHFGVMVVINLAIGLVTPPQASNLAAAAGQAGVGMWRAAGAAWPFIAVALACLLAVAYMPELSLWLPRALGWPV